RRVPRRRRARVAPARRRDRRSSPGKRRQRSSDSRAVRRPVRQLDLVALDQRVRKELLAHPLELGAGVALIGSGDLALDDATDAGAGHREAEVLERALDGLALRIEDAVLRANENRGFHPRTTSGLAS